MKSTRKFESVTVPFATVRFTAGDLSFASRIGTALAEAVLSRLDKNTTTNNASAILGYIVAGMQEVSSRADRVSPQIIDAADPEYTQATYSNSQESSAVDQASEQLKKFQQNAAIEQVAERLMNAWETSDDTMVFFGAFGMRLMLRMEPYLRSMALALQEASSRRAKLGSRT